MGAATSGARPSGGHLNGCPAAIRVFVQEGWIQSIQVECLDHFMVLRTAHLNHLVEEFVAHYHEERPHQGSTTG
jgi:hypothetical protein